ncbi:hypothetical protein [Sediminibacterium sp.]|uniref:hypothetical protein n=1 Tax=Sediminibacterium sp. TaxID=1917865 RepID=UPI0025DEFC64|nr:hypothetical protein [Sediminibacterium sp.]MBT9483780.1 hypothetical protein [Sediminibacterium sp.]
MELTQEQYFLVSDYCRKTGKQFYDVELELTDHIVNYIEDRLTDTKNFSSLFEEIKQDFNKKAISNIITEKATSIECSIKLQLRSELLQYLSLPKIAVTFLLVALVIWLDQNYAVEKIAASFIHLINALNITYAFGKGKLANDNIRDKKKNLLSMKVIRDFHIIFIIPSIFYLLISLGIIFEITNSYLFIYKIALYLLPAVILLNLAWQEVYIKSQLKIRQQYPNAFAQ